uniref:Uncharacterized protein n=1 Tax=Anguilla anguilla TaxID=7936 RepID=A0A0E9TXB4_ANGAN
MALENEYMGHEHQKKLTKGSCYIIVPIVIFLVVFILLFVCVCVCVCVRDRKKCLFFFSSLL